jgi:hypothetical protein
MVCVGFFASIGLAILSTPLPARALAIRPPPPGPARVAQADTLIVGRVVALEDKDIPASPFAGAPNKVNYRIAVVKVNEAIKGAKGKDTIRVGFQAPGGPGRPGGPIIRPGIGRLNVALTVGQDGLFYLAKHHQENFFVLPAFYSFSSSQNPDFAKEVALSKKLIKLLDDPMTALKSKDREERFLAASTLISRYRSPRPGFNKTEAVNADESKLILGALAEADWSQPFQFGKEHPIQLFNQLNLTKADGWTPPQQVKTPQDFQNAARDWVRANMDTYRIQRYVAGEQRR